MPDQDKRPEAEVDANAPQRSDKAVAKPEMPPEIGGPAGKEPTRYGDWERNGRCSDF